MEMIDILKKEQEKKKQNYMRIEFAAISANEALARLAISGFITALNPTLEELSDVKTAVSEAVTNAIVHAYENRNKEASLVRMTCYLKKDVLDVTIEDWGVGIPDVEKAMEPLYTTKPTLERSGMGFAFMEAFMDDLQVESEPGKGTKVRMLKKLGVSSWLSYEE